MHYCLSRHQVVSTSPAKETLTPAKKEKGLKNGPKNEATEKNDPQNGSSSNKTEGGEAAKGDKGDKDGDREESGNLRARFYSALYAKLLSPDVGGSANPVLFLNLVYKAMRADDRDGPRAAAFAKRMLQVPLKYLFVSKLNQQSFLFFNPTNAIP